MVPIEHKREGSSGMSLRWFIVVVGAVVLIAGVVALFVPVSVTPPNHVTVGCGNAVSADLSEARQRDGAGIQAELEYNASSFLGTANYEASCRSSLTTRRAWSIPLAAIGALALAGALLVRKPN
jgi:hypothetical protein